MLRRLLPLLVIVSLAGCERSNGAVSQEIARQFHLGGGGSVNLAQTVPGRWEQVCVLGPYSDNQAAARTLGFDWNAEAKSSIRGNDTITVLVFVKDGQVLDFIEHPRGDGDFSRLAGKCFPREESAFVHEPIPTRGWPGLVSKAVRR